MPRHALPPCSAIVLLVLHVLAFVAPPNLTAEACLSMQLVAPFLLVPVAAFLLPLRGMHDLLKAEKARRRNEASGAIPAVRVLERFDP